MPVAGNIGPFMLFADGSLLKRLGGGRAVTLRKYEETTAIAFIRPIRREDVQHGQLVLDTNQVCHGKKKIVTTIRIKNDTFEALAELYGMITWIEFAEKAFGLP